jgi:uncharacterized protein (TIRG00374 family)
LILDRVVALFALLFLIIALSLLNYQLLKENMLIQWLVGAALLIMFITLVVAVISFSDRFRISRFYSFITLRMPLHKYLRRASDAIYAFRDTKQALLGAALWSLLGHSALATVFLALGSVLMPTASPLGICFLALLGMLANAIPLTPGGLGVGEVAFDRLFAIAGYAGGSLLILTWRFAQLPLCLVGFILYCVGFRGVRPTTESPRQAKRKTGLSREKLCKLLSGLKPDSEIASRKR